ncbi:hypothetical protein SAMN05216196_101540 [Lutimaribacter pacificus]|uniref:Protease inhibitor Inh n=1 Tax=Lutimaribacter pacificus TaxID=391948 RepID=A0A1H0BE12_9RHOB|nr:hypothetical protein [Lutimaribacter pacificus]SDN43841.1 hypothetical protein SAMN05216196_101540 [Lutimaribacter pacificus]SHJ57227.1 hypothetical protein SAMN05444142_101677 [Lutimaribacter pacificus]
MRQLILILALLPLAARAQTPLGAAEFDALTRGHTFTYAESGTPYGAEEYLPNRRVRWSFLDGECKDGVWWEESGQICFVYEDNPDPQCWSFFSGPGGLTARFESDPEGSELYEVGRSSEPLACPGPEVGV